MGCNLEYAYAISHDKELRTNARWIYVSTFYVPNTVSISHTYSDSLIVQ